MENKVQVEIYIRKIPTFSSVTEEMIASLPAYRQAKIRSIRHEQTKAELVTAGLLLRDVLGVTKDEDLTFSKYNKPYLKSGDCFFSVSHDEHIVVLAVAPIEIGVDTEDRKIFSETLIKRTFTEAERKVIAQDTERNAVRYWTRLEAALKLTGEGIIGLDHREFSLSEDNDSFCFETMTYQDSVISVCCKEPFEVRIADS